MAVKELEIQAVVRVLRLNYPAPVWMHRQIAEEIIKILKKEETK